LFPIRFHSNFF